MQDNRADTAFTDLKKSSSNLWQPSVEDYFLITARSVDQCPTVPRNLATIRLIYHVPPWICTVHDKELPVVMDPTYLYASHTEGGHRSYTSNQRHRGVEFHLHPRSISKMEHIAPFCVILFAHGMSLTYNSDDNNCSLIRATIAMSYFWPSHLIVDQHRSA